VAAGSSGDGLENDYQLIKECIYKDCKFLLDISSAGNSSILLYITFHFFLLHALLATSFMVVLEVVPTYIMLPYQTIIFTYLKFGIFVQKIQVCTSLTSWPIQSLERFSLLFRRENQVHFLLEDQQSS
jgi:hypothetical protein